MDRDELINQLFEHALLTFGFTRGVLLNEGMTSAQANEKVSFLRDNLARLFEAAGRLVPKYLQEDAEGRQSV